MNGTTSSAVKKFTYKERNYYLYFLKDLRKDRSYLAFVYMTGIIPIAVSFSSPINCFREYSMLNDKEYYKYFGFTEQEVRDLCSKNKKLTFEDLEDGYNGYKGYNNEKNF